MSSSVVKNTFPATSGAPKPILLVLEDNSELQACIRLILQEKYHLATTEHGQAALRFLRDEGRAWRHPSLVEKNDLLCAGFAAAFPELKTCSLRAADAPTVFGFERQQQTPPVLDATLAGCAALAKAPPAPAPPVPAVQR
jgi:hypothetical protein